MVLLKDRVALAIRWFASSDFQLSFHSQAALSSSCQDHHARPSVIGVSNTGWQPLLGEKVGSVIGTGNVSLFMFLKVHSSFICNILFKIRFSNVVPGKVEKMKFWEGERWGWSRKTLQRKWVMLPWRENRGSFRNTGHEQWFLFHKRSENQKLNLRLQKRCSWAVISPNRNLSGENRRHWG